MSKLNKLRAKAVNLSEQDEKVIDKLNTDNLSEFKFLVKGQPRKDLAVIIDGNGLIQTLFHATYPSFLEDPSIPQYDALIIFGWLNKNVFNKYNPETLVFALDNEKNIRKDMYPEYKAQRGKLKEITDDMTDAEREKAEKFNEAEIAKKAALKSFMAFAVDDIKAVFNTQSYLGYEGDDVINTYAKYLLKLGKNVIIYSDDRDITQLLTVDNIAMHTFRNYPVQDYIDGEIIKDQTQRAPLIFSNKLVYNHVRDKSAHLNADILMPEQVVMHKVLCGDTSDNIASLKFYEMIETTEENVLERTFCEESQTHTEVIEKVKTTQKDIARSGIGKKAAIQIIMDHKCNSVNDLILKLDDLPEKHAKHIRPNISEMVVRERIITLMEVPNFETDLTLFECKNLVEVIK